MLIVCDDAQMRDELRALLEPAGYTVLELASAADVLAVEEAEGVCLITEVRAQDRNDPALQALLDHGARLPVILVTGPRHVPLAVQAMNAGAVDFIEKPVDGSRLLESVAKSFGASMRAQDVAGEIAKAKALMARLTPREKQVLERLVLGLSNKLVGRDLQISPRTVEIHRARIMRKFRARGLSDLVRSAIAASKRTEPR